MSLCGDFLGSKHQRFRYLHPAVDGLATRQDAGARPNAGTAHVNREHAVILSGEDHSRSEHEIDSQEEQ